MEKEKKATQQGKRGKYKKHMNHTVICAVCGKPFMSSRSTRKYCSKTCTTRYWNTKRGYYSTITPEHVDVINPKELFNQIATNQIETKNKPNPQKNKKTWAIELMKKMQQQPIIEKKHVYCHFIAYTKYEIKEAVKRYINEDISTTNGEKTLSNGLKLVMRETTKEERKRCCSVTNLSMVNFKFIATLYTTEPTPGEFQFEYEHRLSDAYVFDAEITKLLV